MGCGTVMLFVISALSPVLAVEFEISRGELGLVTTSMYAVAFIGTPVAGWLADRVAARRLMITLFASAGVSVGALSVASSYWWIVVVAALAGVPLAISHPATNAIVVRGVDVGRHGMAIGLKQAGVQMTAIVAGFGVPFATAVAGWRLTVLAFGGLMLAPLLLTRGLDVGVLARSTDAEPGPAHVNRSIVLVALFGVLMSVSVAALVVHLPLYLEHAHAMTAARAGTAIGVIGAAGLLGRLLCGWVLDRDVSVTAMLVLVSLGGFAAQAMIIRSDGSTASIIWMGAFLFGLTAGAWPAVAMVAVLRLSPLASTGRASSVVLGPSFLSFVFAPAGIGFVIDVSGSYTLSFLVVLAALGLAVATAIVLRHLAPSGTVRRTTA